MKRFYFLITVLALFACVGKKETFDTVRKTPKQQLTPPGTVWLRSNLFIDECEISNFSYLEFLSWKKRNNEADYNTLLPDTNSWTRADIGSANELIGNYSTGYVYRDHPVVGISYAAAVEFCNWRTDRVNEMLYRKEKKLKGSADSSKAYARQAPKRVKYRLPTQEEWEYAAAAGLDFCNFPLGYENLTHKNLPVNNTLEYYTYFTKDLKAIDYVCNHPMEVKCPTVKINTGKCNRYGLYQMMGNVSELIADSLVKGLNYSMPVFSIEREVSEEGNYTLRSQTYGYTLSKKYSGPQPWIGFRCVCEVY